MKSFFLLIFMMAAALVVWNVEAKCRCPSLGGVVCGTNGVTYKNECRLRCAAATIPGLAVAGRNTCNRIKHPCICFPELRPVCGTDGVTYKNQCEILCANTRDGKKSLDVKYLGECTSDSVKQAQNQILTLISPYGKDLKQVFKDLNPPPNNSQENNPNKTNESELQNIFHEDSKKEEEKPVNIFHEDTGNPVPVSKPKEEKLVNIFHEDTGPDSNKDKEEEKLVNIFHEDTGPDSNKDKEEEKLVNIFHEDTDPDSNKDKEEEKLVNIFHEDGSK